MCVETCGLETQYDVMLQNALYNGRVTVAWGLFWGGSRSTKPRDAAKRIVVAACPLHGACVGEEAGARNLMFFRVKWLQAAMGPVVAVCSVMAA